MEYAEQRRRLIKSSILANVVLLLGALGLTLSWLSPTGKVGLPEFFFLLFAFAGLIAVQIVLQPILWGWALKVEPETRVYFIFSGLVLGAFFVALLDIILYLLTGSSMLFDLVFDQRSFLMNVLTLIVAGSLFVYTKPRQLPWFAVVITQVSDLIALVLFPLLSTAIGFLMSLR